MYKTDSSLNSNLNKSTLYIPHLDVLRAFAVILVVFEHFLSDWNLANLGVGKYGVDIFFVISGFLISRILLNQKFQFPEGNKLKMIRNFFIRRFFRLFPAYYLLLIVLAILSLVTGVWVWNKGEMWYYFTYSPNVLFYLKGFQSKLLNHTWSLGIEEQFYLLWPLLIFFIPSRFILLMISSFVVIGFLSKSFFYECISKVGDVNFLPIGNFNTLGIGALLAFIVVKDYRFILKFFERWGYCFIIIVLIIFSITIYIYNESLFFSNCLITVLSALLVFKAYSGYNYFLKNIFELRFLNYLGKISYGIYLYHKPIPLLIQFTSKKIDFEMNSFIGLSISLIITLILAHFSFILFEAPIMQLKDKFQSNEVYTPRLSE